MSDTNNTESLAAVVEKEGTTQATSISLVESKDSVNQIDPQKTSDTCNITSLEASQVNSSLDIPTHEPNLLENNDLMFISEATENSINSPAIYNINNKCDICVRFFSSKRNLKKHIESRHNSRREPETPKEIVCEYCGERFVNVQIFKKHQRIVHLIETPIIKKCTLCDKGFACSQGLIIHMRIHKKEVCNICGKKFLEHFELHMHRRRVHKSGPFACEICGETFYLADSFRCHLNVHKEDNDFCCYMCGYTFSNNDSLEKHVLLNHADTAM